MLIALLVLSLTAMIHAATHSLSRVIRSPLPVVYVSHPTYAIIAARNDFNLMHRCMITVLSVFVFVWLWD